MLYQIKYCVLYSIRCWSLASLKDCVRFNLIVCDVGRNQLINRFRYSLYSLLMNTKYTNLVRCRLLLVRCLIILLAYWYINIVVLTLLLYWYCCRISFLRLMNVIWVLQINININNHIYALDNCLIYNLSFT